MPPFVAFSVGAGLRGYDIAQELAAASPGAPWLLAFISSFGEGVVSYLISGGGMSTLPRRIDDPFRNKIQSAITAILILLVAVTVFALGSLRQRRR